MTKRALLTASIVGGLLVRPVLMPSAQAAIVGWGLFCGKPDARYQTRAFDTARECEVEDDNHADICVKLLYGPHPEMVTADALSSVCGCSCEPAGPK